jgi:hypothetical protein
VFALFQRDPEAFLHRHLRNFNNKAFHKIRHLEQIMARGIGTWFQYSACVSRTLLVTAVVKIKRRVSTAHDTSHIQKKQLGEWFAVSRLIDPFCSIW